MYVHNSIQGVFVVQETHLLISSCIIAAHIHTHIHMHTYTRTHTHTHMHTHSILCITYVAIVMAIKTSTAWVHHVAFNSTTSSHTDPLPPDHTIALWPTKFTGLLTAISYCSLAFVCHFNLLPLQKELQKPTRCRLNMIVIGSMVIAFALYNVVIFSGYFNVSVCV